MLIALVSAKGAPGVTASALALTLTWPRHALLVECDPRGGDILAGFCGGRIPASLPKPASAGGRNDGQGRGGVLNLILSARNGPLEQELWNHVLELPDGTARHFLLPGLEAAKQAGAMPWPRLTSLFRSLHDNNMDVLADCGEYYTQNFPAEVLRAADLVVLVTRTTMPAVRTALSTAEAVRTDLRENGLGGNRLAVLLVDDPDGYPLADATSQFAAHDLPVVTALPWQTKTARVLSFGHDVSNSYLHSRLMKAAAAAAQMVGARAHAHRREAESMHSPRPPATSGSRVNSMLMGERHGT